MNMKKWSALLGAVAVMGVAGCADRNKNGQPDSPATPGEISKTADKAGKAATTVVKKAGNAMKDVDDSVMTPKIQAAYIATPALKGVTINVTSKDKGITLAGTVKTAAQKKMAGDIAGKNAPGYKILNNLKVGGAAPMMNKQPTNKKSN